MKSVSRMLAALAVGAVVAFGPAVLAQPAAPAQQKHEPSKSQDDFSENVPGAAALEGRIIAPCCWTQTIDIHGSEISTELRHEIRQRLKAGESADAIQADLVTRYGPKILAVPPGNPLKDVGLLLMLGFGAAGIGAGAMILRWRKRTQLEKAVEPDEKPAKTKKKSSGKKAEKTRDQYDDQIDAELDKL